MTNNGQGNKRVGKLSVCTPESALTLLKKKEKTLVYTRKNRGKIERCARLW